MAFLSEKNYLWALIIIGWGTIATPVTVIVLTKKESSQYRVFFLVCFLLCHQEFQLCLCPFGSVHEHHWQTHSESFAPVSDICTWHMYHVCSLSCLFQLLGHQCWKSQVDLPSPHYGGHCCKNLFMTHSTEGHPTLQWIHSSEPAGQFPALCQHSACSGLQTVGNKHGEIGPPAAVQVKPSNKVPCCHENAVAHHRPACAPDLQEAAQVHAGPHALVWSSLHGVHGAALHWGDRAAVAGADALWDVLQFLPGQHAVCCASLLLQLKMTIGNATVTTTP